VVALLKLEVEGLGLVKGNGNGSIGPSVELPQQQLIGESPAIRCLKTIGVRAAKRPSTVMILGESGSGKEVLARFIHESSPRAAMPFVPVDCTAFSETLFESQLFGHVRGAFTGAVRDTLGFVRAADGGTIFLDEIGELAPPLQAKLLRVLQDRRVTPVGATRSFPVDIRVISATHRNLEAMVAASRFRLDLLFRLQVITMTVPPLREHREDIHLLAENFLLQQAQANGETVWAISEPALAALENYSWPGNVRELCNALEQASVLADGNEIELHDLPLQVRTPVARPRASDMNLNETIRRQVIEALLRSGYRRTYAAALLGIDRRRLNRFVTKFKIPIDRAAV
jgi:transcriptional regulator with PAS, ATPase and Fis domain